ncbi:MAG: hypothetical protein H6733_08540 [Alphaproteobacteria bacterium]|nr:hypothetical protein [Alphaproteobacteria bacterium]
MRARRAWAPIVVAAVGGLGGCAPSGPTEAAWLTSWSFDWALANHRVSFLAMRPTADGVEGGFVGGASTTGRTFDDDGTCLDPVSCWELPGFDPALVTARRVALTSTEVVLTTARTHVVVGADGLTSTVSLTLPHAARGEAAAWIGGFAWSSAPPDGPGVTASCYDPRHGWLPSRLAITLGTPTVDGVDVSVPVTVAFTAGVSRETQRVCLDAAAPEATMGLDLDVVVAVSPEAAGTLTVHQGASWPGIGDDQDLADAGTLTAALPADGVVAWSSLDLRFQQEVDPGRGAYVRSLQTELLPEDGSAYTFVTNRSFTQLEGFDYAFDGTVVTLPVADAAFTVTEHGADDLSADLDADGQPVFHVIPPLP